MLTICEKLTGLTFTKNLFNGAAKETLDALVSIFNKDILTNKVRSMTFDNGSEFAMWEAFENTTNIPVYFAKPGRPWEKPTIEYANKLLRQPFPRKSNLKEFSHVDVELATILLNNRPRKKLGYLNPSQFFELC